jgi:hypothetical protein
MRAKRLHTMGFDLVGESVGVLALAGCGGGGAVGAAGEGEDAPSPNFGGALAKNAVIPGPEAGFLASFFGVDIAYGERGLFFWRADALFRLLKWAVGASLIIGSDRQSTRHSATFSLKNGSNHIKYTH